MKVKGLGKMESREKTGEGLEIESHPEAIVEKGLELYQFITGYYCAGAIAKDGKFIQAAPIISWMVGHQVKDVIQAYNKGAIYRIG